MPRPETQTAPRTPLGQTGRLDLAAEEYRFCRELTLENLRAMDRNEVYTLGAVAVTMGFSLSTPNDAVAVCSAMIPFAITYVARLRYIGIGIMVRSLNNFMVKKETTNSSIGWNTYQREAGAGAMLRANRFLFWKVLAFGSAGFF